MVVVLAGVSGSGKTTIGVQLATRLGCVFEDGDALHPAANIAKMHAGVPLTDEDRWPWLQRVGSWIDRQAAAGASGVIACSALKRSYRDFLRQGRPEVRVVLLNVDRNDLATRLSGRHDHFFPATLLSSQLSELELPAPGEQCLMVPATESPAEVADDIIRHLDLSAPPPG
jgi:carbohydrate kinase (thermoresistant glucokinase family)